MSRYGRYQPENPGHSCSLFSYGEVPLASQKLNRWNGNVAAALEWLNRCASILLAGLEGGVILGEETALELAVTQQPTADLTVCVRPGKAVVSETFVGLDEMMTLPQVGGFIPPIVEPRYDLISLDADGDLTVVQGNEGDPEELLFPQEGALPLAKIFLRPGMVSILDDNDGFNGYIIDIRPQRILGVAHTHSFDRSPVETPDGSRTHFSTSHQLIPDSLEVYVNGVLQLQDAAYSVDADEQGYDFAEAPPTGFQIQHRYCIKG